jgi:hypothetical protein
MKNVKLAIAITSALTALASHHVMADWENLPIGGVSVGGGTSPYILCNTTSIRPTSISDACAVLPSSDTMVPDSGYVGMERFPVVNRTTSIVMNNSYTNNTNITLGTLREYVWRRSTGEDAYECIYAMKVNMTFTDYDLNTPYQQLFEINDMARKGWASKTIDVAYSLIPVNAYPTYRIGRTFTSVKQGVDQPPIGLGSSPAITTTQKADLDSDWVDFTTRVGDIGNASGMQYIRTSCSGGAFSTAADAIRLRQTSRVGQPAIEVEVEGVIPN